MHTDRVNYRQSSVMVDLHDQRLFSPYTLFMSKFIRELRDIGTIDRSRGPLFRERKIAL